MAESPEKPQIIAADIEAPVKRSKVKLKKPHTHAGVVYDEDAVKAGVEIEVSDAQTLWLKTQGII